MNAHLSIYLIHALKTRSEEKTQKMDFLPKPNALQLMPIVNIAGGFGRPATTLTFVSTSFGHVTFV